MIAYIWYYGLVPFFNGISSFVSYLLPKSPLQNNSRDTIWPIAVEGEGCSTPFARGYKSKREQNSATAIRTHLLTLNPQSSTLHNTLRRVLQ